MAKVASGTPPSSSKRPISYDQDLTSIEATFSVDDLVADSTSDNYGHLFGGFYPSPSSTPSIPPGFPPQPQLHSQPVRDELQPKSSLMTATSVPFTPKRNGSIIPQPAMPLASASLSDGSQSNTTPTSQEKQKHNVQTLAKASGLSETIAAQSEDFPALGSQKAKAPVTPTPSKVKLTSTAASRKASATTPAAVQTPSKSDKHPGILNISVPKVTARTPSDAPANEPSTSTAFPPLPPSTPSASSIQSPMSTKAPKTLRIASSMKPETPAAGSATPSSVTSAFPPQFPPSRQPSLASMSRHERPGTPTSEMVSDNASITSTSMSRANSPPPSVVGSAPVRKTTKSRHKKQRREVAKEQEKSELEAAAAKTEPKVEEIAPIMGKKRKQKKERTINSAAGGSTPAASRPASPSPAITPVPEDSQMEKTRRKQSPAEPEVVKTKDTKGKGKAKNQHPTPIPTPPSPTIASVPDSPPPTTKPIPTPFTTLQQLASTGAIPDPAHLSLLKPPTTTKLQLDAELQSLGQKLTITPEDRTALLAGHPVHKSAPGPSRIMLTPNGDYVRNLTPEEEARYLQLQSHLAESAGPASFVSGKHNSGNGFTLIGGRAVPNGPPSFFPVPTGTVQGLDPVSKIQRDEALSYINQYVLPSLSTNKQLENALNANALDNFPSWGGGGGGDEGVLAGGINGMTAHFAVDGGVGGGSGSGRPLGNVSLLGCREAESAMVAARKEAEGIEKRLSALVKKNKRLLLGSGH